MNSANGEKIRDDEQKLSNCGYLPTTSPNEKQHLKASEERHSKMPSLRKCFLTLLAFCLLAVAFCSANANARVPRSPSPRDQRKFQELLNSIEPSSLNEVLHNHIDKYKPGFHQEDKTAIAVVHQQTPQVAPSLVDLAKRQDAPNTNGNATSSTVVTTDTTSTFTSSVTTSAVTTQTSDSTSSPGTEDSTSPSTTPSGTVGSSTGTSTSETGNTATKTTATSASEGSSTPTDSGSQSSSSPPTTSRTSTHVFTTTLPNGHPTTVTQTTVVPGGGLPDQTGGGGPTKTGGSPSLQTNEASSRDVGTSVIMGMMGIFFLGTL